MRLILLLVSFSLLMKNSKEQKQEASLAGAKNAKNNEHFPFFVQLRIRVNAEKINPPLQKCSGTLIHLQWVLTAAQCFEGAEIDYLENNKAVLVIAGTVRKYDEHHKDGKLNWARRIYSHPDYHLEKDSRGRIHKSENDIAVCKLAKPYKLSKSVQTAYLANVNFRPSPKTKRCRKGIILSMELSWLAKDLNSQGPILQYANMTSYAWKKYQGHGGFVPSKTTFFTKAVLRVGHPTKDDMGDPFLCYENSKRGIIPVVYGIESSSWEEVDHAHIYKLSVYEEVDRHIEFILDYLDKLKHFRVDNSTKPPPPRSSDSSAISLSFFVFIFILLL